MLLLITSVEMTKAMQGMATLSGLPSSSPQQHATRQAGNYTQQPEYDPAAGISTECSNPQKAHEDNTPALCWMSGCAATYAHCSHAACRGHVKMGSIKQL